MLRFLPLSHFRFKGDDVTEDLHSSSRCILGELDMNLMQVNFDL